MKLAIVGSRNFSRPDLVREFVQKLAAKDPTVIIVSGGAAGVDTWAVEAARACGLATEVYQADWARYGRGAGVQRNTTIVEVSDKGAAFWDGVSRGTMDTVKKFQKAGKPIKVITVTSR